MTMKTKPPFLRTPYNYDTREASAETALRCPEPTRTQQQFKEESDINYIAERYGLTGEMPQVLQLPSYGSFEGIFDFQTAQNAVIEARKQFMTLPAKMRSRFNNDPQQLITFLEDPDNRAEAEFLGLVEKKQPPNTPQDAPQSPKGNPAGADKGGTPPPASKPAGEPPAKNPKTDT